MNPVKLLNGEKIKLDDKVIIYFYDLGKVLTITEIIIAHNNYKDKILIKLRTKDGWGRFYELGDIKCKVYNINCFL